MYSAILFDKDGCLLDFDKTWGQWAKSLLTTLADGDAGLLAELALRVGYRLGNETFEPDSAVIAGTPEEGVRLLLPLLPNWTYDALLEFSNERASKAPLAPVVPLRPLLGELRGVGMRLGVATNDSEATAKAHMAALDVAEQFDLILGSDSGYGGKPAPGMQRAFTAHLGIDPKQCIMVGDSLHDLHSGRTAGMTCVGVLTGPASEADLIGDADVVLPDIGYLPEWIAKQR